MWDPPAFAVGCFAGDRFQLVWVTSHAELLKEAEADELAEKTFPGQVRASLAAAVRPRFIFYKSTYLVWKPNSRQQHVSVYVQLLDASLWQILVHDTLPRTRVRRHAT
jgi:hypothetical protein